MFLAVLVKWSIHIAYGIDKINFLWNIVVYLQFFEQALTNIFSPLSDIGTSKKNNMYRNRGYASPYGMNGMYRNNGNMPPYGMNGTGVGNIPSGVNGNNMGNPSYTGEREKKQYASHIVTGVIIALPCLFIVLILLVSADAVFRELVSDLLFGIDNVWDAIKFTFIFIMAYFSTYACGKLLIIKRINVVETNNEKASAVTEITFIGIFSVVYVVFCIIQLIGLLSRSDSILPSGYTYAKYARTGFFQLLVVCVINIFMVILCRIRFEENSALKALLTIISFCTYIMTVSSAYTMVLYIHYYHLTFMRVVVLWALAVIAILMVFVTWFIFNDNIKLFEYGLTIVTVMFLILAFMRPDYIIMNYNIERFGEEHSDATYLFYHLSMDGAETLIDSNIATDYPHKGDMTIYCIEIVEKYESKYKGDIRKFNWSRYQAYKAAKRVVKIYMIEKKRCATAVSTKCIPLV